MKKNKLMAIVFIFFIFSIFLQGCVQKSETKIKESENTKEKIKSEKKSEISRIYELTKQNFIEIDINKLEE
ncbi:MAG: hypothetical protein QXZ13_01090 [Candidatus Diapherotrites archaeon]